METSWLLYVAFLALLVRQTAADCAGPTSPAKFRALYIAVSTLLLPCSGKQIVVCPVMHQPIAFSPGHLTTAMQLCRAHRTVVKQPLLLLCVVWSRCSPDGINLIQVAVQLCPQSKQWPHTLTWQHTCAVVDGCCR